MNPFRVLYYPNSECHPLVLAKSILIFDEMIFFDHPSVTFKSGGTVGHDSLIRQVVPVLRKEGYFIDVIQPRGGPVEGELEKIIDADLGNEGFRKTFFELMRNDPSFLINMVPNGNYGKHGDAATLRQKILTIPESAIPRTASEISSFKTEYGIPPEMMIAITMAADSYKFNLSTYLAIDRGVQLFGDSTGMDMLLNAKFQEAANDVSEKELSHKVAFTLLNNLISNQAFAGKSFTDIVRFRNKMNKEREKFKERVLEMTMEIQNLKGAEKQSKINQIIYKHMLPEARKYQNKMADNWDRFFKGSTKAVLSDATQITQLIVTSLAISFTAALLAGAARVGINVLPHLIDYLKEKEALERRNPYTYLMKFK